MRPLLILLAFLLVAAPVHAQMLGLPGSSAPGLKVFSAGGGTTITASTCTDQFHSAVTAAGVFTCASIDAGDLGTTLTPQFARLGLGVAADATNLLTLAATGVIEWDARAGIASPAAGILNFTDAAGTGHATGFGLGTTTPKTINGNALSGSVVHVLEGTDKAVLAASGVDEALLSLLDSDSAANTRWFWLRNQSQSVSMIRVTDALAVGATYATFNLATDAVTLGSGTTTTVNIQSSDNKVSVLSAANAASLNLKHATTTVTCNSGTASCTASNLIPAGATVVSITARVTTILAGTGLTTWSLGDGVTADLWATGKALAAGTTVAATDHKSTWNIKFYNAANNVVLTAAAGQFDSGVVRLTVHYFDSTAPTS